MSGSLNASSIVLVTGGAGFIGSHLVERLAGLGAQVTVFDNLSTGRRSNLRRVESVIRFVQGNVVDVAQTVGLDLATFDFIFHLAANPYIPTSVEDPVLDYRSNLESTFVLLETLRHLSKRPRLINVSSAAVYGNPASLPTREEDPTVPISPYGVSKLAAERYTAIYSQIYGIDAVSLRFFSVYGPRQRKQVVYDLLGKLKSTPHNIEVLGDGSQARDFAYVEDVVDAVLVAATNAPGRGEVYNVASGATHTIAELVAAWCAVGGWAPTISYTGHVRPGDAEKWVVDITRLQALGYTARTSLRQGLEAIYRWHSGIVGKDE